MIDWTRDTVASRATDDAVLRRAAKLARPEDWTDLGADVDKVWGNCPGSKGAWYQVTLYRESGHCRCACPSRQQPCKHGLALMLLLVESPEALGIATAPEVQRVPLDRSLSEARAAVDAGDRPGALVALLDAWRAAPVVELAELIDRLDEKITGERAAALADLKRSELQGRWIALARAGDPADLGGLLATIGRATNEEAIARIEALAAWPADPRISGRLVEMLERWEVLKSDKAASFWRAAFRLMLAIEDTRVLPVLDGLGDSHRHKMGIYTFLRMKEEIGELRERLRARDAQIVERARLNHEAQQLLDALRARIAPAASAGEQSLAQRAETLLGEIYARPDDDQLRLVYADLLTELGDPRGELIALQFARLSAKPKPAAKKREQELLQTHRSEWLGPLSHFLLKKELQFERGFVDTAHYNHERYFDVESVLGDPRWRTLRVLRSWQPPALTFHPEMVSLREVEIDERGFETLRALQGTRPFTTMTLIDDGSLANGPLLEAAHKLPALTALTVRGEDNTATEITGLERLSAFVDHALARQLHELTLRTPLRLTRDWLARLGALPALQRVTLLSRNWELGNWDLVFSRATPGGPFDALAAVFRSGDYGQDSLPDLLPALQSLAPGDLTSLQITARAQLEGDFATAFRDELARLAPPKRKLPKSWAA